MGTRKEHQNLVDARNYFGIDLSKDTGSRYQTHIIDDELINKGYNDGMNPNCSLENVDESIKNHANYKSYVDGFNRARRMLKIQSDLYIMGSDYYSKGFDINDIPALYVDNQYFMAGYNDAKNNKNTSIKTSVRR